LERAAKKAAARRANRRDLVHEVLLYRIGMVGKLFEEGKEVGQCRRV
jgi:hypothetical protein